MVTRCRRPFRPRLRWTISSLPDGLRRSWRSWLGTTRQPECPRCGIRQMGSSHREGVCRDRCQAVSVAIVPRAVRSGGRSLGGSGALFLAYRLPQLFGGVVAQSGGFHYSRSPAEWSAAQSADALADGGFPEHEWLTQEIAKAPHLPIRIYLETGAFEDVRYETRERPRYNAGTVLSGTRHLRDVLIAKGYALAYHEFIGTHRSVNWQGTFADGVVFALGGK